MVEKMGKIVGKFFITIFLFCAVIIDARVVMEIRPENGVRDRVVVGQSFIIDVIIDDVYGSVQAPTIHGLGQFNAQLTGQYTSSINGKSMARYSYQVRIDTLGSYTIGPAVVRYQQQEQTSNQVSVAVVKDIATTGPQGKNSAQQEVKAFLRLMVDSESVVVGQKIGCILRFYYQDSSLSLTNVGMPDLPAFDIKTIGNLESGIADNNGVQYRYAQWRWDMYPTKPGEFIIPAYNIDFEVPNQDNRLLGGLFMFINTRADSKRVYSNAITIKVAPLPHYNGPVHAIGAFERLTAEIKPGMAKEGEGMVLALEIEGVGNLDAIAIPVLTMPDALKYYDSNNAVIMPKNSDDLPKKRFEFIVQGMQYGDWEIPEQLFTYFDIEKHSYATLRTSPLVVSIMPGVNSNKKDSASSIDVLEASIIIIEDGIAPINTVGPWYPVTERQPLPWWLFHSLFLMPCLYLCYGTAADTCVVLSNKFLRGRRRRAFKEARKKIDQSLALGDDKNLYTIFVQLFLLCNQQQAEMHSAQDIEKVLRERGASVVLMNEWSSFFEAITHAAYAKSGNNSSSADELCRVAKQWIDRLEKIL
jgi:hypothetical protein